MRGVFSCFLFAGTVLQVRHTEKVGSQTHLVFIDTKANIERPKELFLANIHALARFLQRFDVAQCESVCRVC